MTAARRSGGRDEIHVIRAKGNIMFLATTTVEDVDRFLEVFGTKGADKRAAHGSKGSTVFRDPSEANRVWALFDWDEAGLGTPSCPIPTCRRSSRRPVISTSPSPPRCSARTGRRRGWTDDQYDRSAGPRGRHHRPDRRAVLHGHRQRERGQDGHRRHQLAGRSARPPCRRVRRGQRHRRRRGRSRGRPGSSPPTWTSSSAGSTARPARRSRARWSTRPASSTSTPSSTRGRNAIR